MPGSPDTSLCCSSLVASPLNEADATELAGILKALADPVRLRIVSLVASTESGELCACDMPAMLDRSQPTISHHLTLLAKAGLLEREQRGKWAWFRLCGDRLAELGTLLADTDCR
ncbi:MAG: helix-turn-helix transcriptional regulator [Actinomycetia bacterium]|nr:helix-turn-helix transcriptional regulator [Actinomycetes bacterium]MCP4959722.1 helix-turn-helix transcriptional regulator [Actinomycetes bacterium]